MAKKSATHENAPDDDLEVTLQDVPPDVPPDVPLSAQLQTLVGQLARQQSANAPIPPEMVGQLAAIVSALEDLGV